MAYCSTEKAKLEVGGSPQAAKQCEGGLACFFSHLYCSREATSRGASKAALTTPLWSSTTSSGSEEDGMPQAPTHAHTKPRASLSMSGGQVQVAHSRPLGERASFRLGSSHICTCRNFILGMAYHSTCWQLRGGP